MNQGEKIQITAIKEQNKKAKTIVLLFDQITDYRLINYFQKDCFKVEQASLLNAICLLKKNI